MEEGSQSYLAGLLDCGLFPSEMGAGCNMSQRHGELAGALCLLPGQFASNGISSNSVRPFRLVLCRWYLLPASEGAVGLQSEEVQRVCFKVAYDRYVVVLSKLLMLGAGLGVTRRGDVDVQLLMEFTGSV